MKDVVLIMPPNNFTDMISPRKEKNLGYYVHYPPLGLCYIAAVLVKNNISVRIIDAIAENLMLDDIVKILKVEMPKFVGITTTTPTLRVVKKLIEKIRSSINTEIILGGPHISCDPEITFFLGADVGFVGENEYSFLDFVKGNAKSQIMGLIWKDNDKINVNHFPVIENLDELPYPARHLLNNKKYSNPVNSLTTTSLIASRGCPYDCLFCSRASRGKKYHIRSVDNILPEIKDCINKFGIKYITFMDETFTYKKQWVEELCEKIIEEKIKFSWAAQTRVNLIDKELLRKMKRAGCVNLSFGVESASEKTRELLGKPVDFNDYKNLVRWAKELKIETNAYYMLGHPHETKEDILNTIKFAKELNTDYASFNITTIFPASNLYNELIKEGKIKQDIWRDYALCLQDIPSYVPQNLKKDDLEKLISTAFKSFYLRPKYIFNRILKIRKLSDIVHHLKILSILLKDYILRK